MTNWIKDALFYEIYPISFKDSNGDGMGDLKGIIEKLDYVKDLGFNAIWLNPFYKSTFKDGGYDVTLKLLKLIKSDISEVGEDTLTLKLANNKNISALAKELNVGEETLQDIITELEKPGRDIRDINVRAELRNDVCEIEDLKEGMILDGTVRNIIDFGAFVDIGVHQDGLVHIKEISNKFVKHPLDVLKIGQIVKVKVIGVDVKKRRISLSIKQAN